MAHITLSIPDELHQDMKKHPEIKWSEAARKGIREQIAELKVVMKGSELFSQLSLTAQKNILKLSQFSKEDWREWHRKVKEKDRKRAKYLMQA